jgi:hypothetical protein
MLKPYSFQRGKQKGDAYFFCTKQDVTYAKEKCSCSLCLLSTIDICIRMGKETLVHFLYILSLHTERKYVIMFRPLYLSGKSYRSHWIVDFGGPTADLRTVNLCPCRTTNRFSPVALPIPER